MPLVGLVRLRWALGGATPPFDPIARPRSLQHATSESRGNRKKVLGDTETAAGRQCPDDLLHRESRLSPARGTYRKSVTRTAQEGF